MRRRKSSLLERDAALLPANVGVKQDLTIGTLTVVFSVWTYKVAPELMLSLVTSAVLLGMKPNMIFLLKPLYGSR